MLRVVSPDRKLNRVVSQTTWEVYGWSKDGSRVLGITHASGRRLNLQQLNIDSAHETRIADLVPVPPEIDLADHESEFPYRGFSLNSDGTSFLTSVLRFKTGIYVIKDFNRPVRLIDWVFRKYGPSTSALQY